MPSSFNGARREVRRQIPRGNCDNFINVMGEDDLEDDRCDTLSRKNKGSFSPNSRKTDSSSVFEAAKRKLRDDAKVRPPPSGGKVKFLDFAGAATNATGKKKLNFESSSNQARKEARHQISSGRKRKMGSLNYNSCSVFKNNLSGKRKLCDDAKIKLPSSSGMVEFLAGTGKNGEWFSSTTAAADKRKVLEVLEAFGKALEQRVKEAKLKGEGWKFKFHRDAVRKVDCINTKKRVGLAPGVEIGDTFRYRAELYVIGLHGYLIRGIDYMNIGGEPVAVSIVATERYRNEIKSSDVLIYSGEGGNPTVSRKPVKDQVLERGNLALQNSMDRGWPVRVVLTGRKSSVASFLAGCTPKNKIVGATYVYDGLYLVQGKIKKRGEYGASVFEFELKRMEGQPAGFRESKKRKAGKEVQLVNDISEGKESVPIALVNAFDGERPSKFTYIAHREEELSSPKSSGCDCADQCSNSKDCKCKSMNVIANDDNKGLAILLCIYECGLSCKCSDSCTTRVSQLGIKRQLDVFMTESKGWGARSRAFIPAGAFLCEFVGRVIETEEAEEEIGLGDYFFDIGYDYEGRINEAAGLKRQQYSKHLNFSEKESGMTIDARHRGNIARFVNHSCSPNLVVKNVRYSSEGTPHVMLFAKASIPPRAELTYDYSCRTGRSRYMRENLKWKKCMCKAGCDNKFLVR